jgi:prolyl 4-hydroxylase
LPRLLSRLRRRAEWLFDRRYYFLNKAFGSRIPVHNLSYLPDGFTVRKVGQTGISVVDGFCTPQEAQAIIELARERLVPSAVQQNGKFVLDPRRKSDTALVFGPDNRDPALLDVACRAAALTGLPYTNLEGVYVTRYLDGGYYDEHVDYGPDFRVDRLYTVLLYLNDMEPIHGGSTAFPRLNVEVQPRIGRAVSWTNMNPDRSPHLESSHIAMPVKPGGEKWTIQFWFHPHRMFDEIDVAPPQASPGIPLAEDAKLPDGARYFRRNKD